MRPSQRGARQNSPRHPCLWRQVQKGSTRRNRRRRHPTLAKIITLAKTQEAIKAQLTAMNLSTSSTADTHALHSRQLNRQGKSKPPHPQPKPDGQKTEKTWENCGGEHSRRDTCPTKVEMWHFFNKGHYQKVYRQKNSTTSKPAKIHTSWMMSAPSHLTQSTILRPATQSQPQTRFLRTLGLTIPANGDLKSTHVRTPVY